MSGLRFSEGQALGDGGRYQIVEKLGEGGMGMVYRANDANLETDIVVKMPHANMLGEKGFAERFRREVRSLVALSHPHVVKILDVGLHGEVPFAVMQYLAGGSLEDRLKRGEGVEPEIMSGWLMDVAKALDFVHRKQFVHRDIKPANILFDIEGIAYVSDFGVAKATSDAAVGQTQNQTLTSMGMV